uniref:Interleukin-6 receptor subunit alpha n=1 Tax=Fundulus heteroclitus TaxID=8078 RepID=A0A3Q2PWJ9_FUNHE
MRGPLPAMDVLLLLLCFLCVTQVCSIFDNVCPRKDPPPGVLVVSPGSRLELTCTGQVKVNGVKVGLTGDVPSKNKRRSSSDRTLTTQQFTRNGTFPNKIDKTSTVSGRYHSPTTAGVSTAQGENRILGYPGTEPNTSPQVVTPTPPSKTTMRGESDREDKEVKLKGEYKDEEGSRVARGLKMRPCWKWNKQLVQTVDRDWGEIAFLGDGSSLSLSSVRRKDAGKYTCHHGGEETFGVKVIVADPPETPSIHCYKKSPSGKIRCEWRPQNPVIKPPECHLFLSKGPSHRKPENFDQIQCSYSSRHACCWCGVEHNDDELRTFHEAFLCVRSFLGNTTSPLIHFTPLDILKPDPPSNVSAHPVERLENTIMVTWKLPISWKDQDYFYDLTYEICYRPLTSSSEKGTVVRNHHYTIKDALPDVDYLIQLRTKEEYDGQWSEWTSPVFARSWKANVVEEVDLMTTMDGLPTTEDFGSGFPDDHYIDGTTTEMCTSSDVLCKPQYHILWISALFAVMSVLLAVYIFRHKERFMSKLLSLSVITHSDESTPPPPSIPSAPEQEALVSGSGPQLYKQSPPSDTQKEEEREEEQTEMDQLEAMNFNNKSYFYLQMEP